MDRILITGLGGFVGQHLARLLLESNHENVYGSVVDLNVESDLPLPKDRILPCDLLDETAVTRLLEEVQPHQIYHVAGIAEVGRSWGNPKPAYCVNVLGQLHLLQAVMSTCPDSRVLVIGSAGEYGLVREEDCPISEGHPLRPADPYSVSKTAQDLMAHQYYLAHGTDIIRTRSFNHIGPGQSPGFLVGRLVQLIAEIERGGMDPVIHFGDLSARRDFTDVRDVVQAYRLLMEKGVAGEAYNVCSGRAIAVADVVRMALDFGEKSIDCLIDHNLERPTDLPLLLGDNMKLRNATGWCPHISLEMSVDDALEYARANV